MASKKQAKVFAPVLGCQLQEVLTSKEAKLVNGRCTSGDLALLVSSKDAPEVVEVWCFAKASNQGRIFALVQCLDLETCSVATRSGTWRLTSNTSFLPVENILGPLTYCQLQPGQVRCLLPWHFCQ